MAETVQVGDIEYRYDDLGRVVGKGDLALTYGPDGHLATARRGQDVWTYHHDQDGNRIIEEKNGRPVAAFLNGTYIIEDQIFTPIHVNGRLIGVMEGGEFHLLGGELLFQTYRWIRYDEPFRWNDVGAATVEGAIWGSGGAYVGAAQGIREIKFLK